MTNGGSDVTPPPVSSPNDDTNGSELARLRKSIDVISAQVASQQKIIVSLTSAHGKLEKKFDKHKAMANKRIALLEKVNRRMLKTKAFDDPEIAKLLESEDAKVDAWGGEKADNNNSGTGEKEQGKKESEKEGKKDNKNNDSKASNGENAKNNSKNNGNDNTVDDSDDDNSDEYEESESDEDDDTPRPEPLEVMNLAKVTGGKCCTTLIKLYFAKDKSILTCPVNSFLQNGSWSSRSDYKQSVPDNRAFMSLIDTLLSPFYKHKTPNKIPKHQRAGYDKNRSYIVLYEGEVPVTVVAFTLGATTTRTHIMCSVIYTTKRYRRRGHGATAFALLKEFALSNPFRPRCDNAFIWLSSPAKTKGFFLSKTVGLTPGWARLKELAPDGENPPVFLGHTKCHTLLTKYYKGGYLEAVIYGAAHPVHEGEERTRERAIDNQTWPEYQVGSRIIVSYPNMKSTATYAATVLNYNHLERRPYYIQYDFGNETEFVVIGRIRGFEPEGGGGATVLSPKGDKRAKLNNGYGAANTKAKDADSP
eukprot:CAMPEP_0118649850 /NCGR_PEP_ID=MMETSP0785-20121206/9926_1 /TAXON_ID=91992 /ORGANISM="Bolidomonas pacifica, Strain CCMP 1866" /LENGTH=532 /DNA_ID=CAMNT_0006542171 /DNA_START=105 /DNA_END=1699 /DNA_ORIENTATION=-